MNVPETLSTEIIPIQASTFALSVLRDATAVFVNRINSLDCESAFGYMKVGTALYEITAAIADAEVLLSRAQIRNELAQVRKLIATSPFGLRMQTWPRGYPGDFETVEWIVKQINKAPTDSIGHLIEAHCLGSAACQQHRNKITYQIQLIAKAAESGPISVLLIASGSALDLQSVWYNEKVRQSRFVLNDTDNDALETAKDCLVSACSPNSQRERGETEKHPDSRSPADVEFICGNSLRLTQAIEAAGPYDLILTGGLFDYLSDRAAGLLIRIAFSRWLKPGGTFYFSNMAKYNPDRHWMEYLEDWVLIERSEADVHELLVAVKNDISAVTVARDPTGLTLLVKATKLL